MSATLSTRDVVRTYTAWAPWYDVTHALLPLRNSARRLLNLKPGEHVLDLACGTGLNFNPLRKQVGAAGEVVGVDLTPAMLERARRRIERHGWTNVRVVEADAGDLPFEDATFDAALCTFALTIIPDYRGAIREVARVLRPGGRFGVLEVAGGPAGHNAGWARRWPRLGNVCGVDFGHDVAGALRTAFGSVSQRPHWKGAFTVFLARHGSGPDDGGFCERETTSSISARNAKAVRGAA